MSKPLFIIVLIACLPFIVPAQGTSTDTLTLGETIQRVIQTYPSVKQADEAVKSAGYNVKMARAALLPVLNASASYMRVEPVATVHFEEMDLSFNPKNNYDAGISISQLLYDFGKNSPKIEAAKQKEAVSKLQKDELYQSLALNTVQMYYMNCFTRQAIKIKQQELNDYKEMLRQTEIRTQSGSSTSFDLLNTQVNQSAVQTQLTDLQSSLKAQQTQLSILTDTLLTDNTPLTESVDIKHVPADMEELITVAYVNRPEMQLVDKKVLIARLDESAVRRAYNPSLDLSASAGAKNGYPVHIDRMKLNYEAGVTLSVPLYEGGRRKQSASLAKSAYNIALYQKELVEKQVHQQVADNFYALMSDYNRTEQLSRQVMLAKEAYSQAKVNYKAGAITNLELLTSSTNLSNSELQLLQSKINYQINYYKLQVSIGTPIW